MKIILYILRVYSSYCFMIGLHIIADFSSIPENNLDISESDIRDFISSTLRDWGLKELWSYYHTFGEKNEITGVIALAESHLSFHIWPEKFYMSLDIFVCNFGEDNSRKAEFVFQKFREHFHPETCEVQRLERYAQKRP